jgi:hypothetical protein
LLSEDMSDKNFKRGVDKEHSLLNKLSELEKENAIIFKLRS